MYFFFNFTLDFDLLFWLYIFYINLNFSSQCPQLGCCCCRSPLSLVLLLLQSPSVVVRLWQRPQLGYTFFPAQLRRKTNNRPESRVLLKSSRYRPTIHPSLIRERFPCGLELIKSLCDDLRRQVIQPLSWSRDQVESVWGEECGVWSVCVPNGGVSLGWSAKAESGRRGKWGKATTNWVLEQKCPSHKRDLHV